MENEIMNNEEVVETVEDIETNSNKAFVVAAGIGLTILVGAIAYKKIIKPLIAKHKAKKELAESNDCAEDDVVDLES